MASTTLSGTGSWRTRRWIDCSSWRGDDLLDPALLDAGGGKQHAPLGALVGVADVDLQQEPVELGFGQRIGALLLQRVLGGQHVERRRHVMALSGDGDVVLLHGLQQRRLRLGAGAVDLVGHQELGEDRALDEAEAAAAAGPAVLQHLRADDVGGHQVGRELDALGVEAQYLAQRLHQQRLGEAGDADQQGMAAGQQRDERALDHLVLAEDDGGCRLVHALHALAGRFDAADDGVVGLCDGAHDGTYTLHRLECEPESAKMVTI